MAVTRRTRARITGTLTVVSAAGAYGLAFQVATAHGATKAVEVAAGVLLTALTGGIPTREQWRQVRERRTAESLAKTATTDLRVAIGDALEPLTGQLGYLNRATEPTKTQLRGEALQQVLVAVAGLVDPNRARACFFRLEQGPPRRLEPNKHFGRSVPPHSSFVSGAPSGDAALEMLETGGRRYCRDVNQDPPPGWAGTTSGYQTFVAVPVSAGGECYGMLTVDALAPGDLAQEEESGLVDVFANLLGAILSV